MGEVELNKLISDFYDNKSIYDKYKKVVDEQNAQIKDELLKFDDPQYVTKDGLQAKVSIANKEEFIEDALMNKIKELGMQDIIKTKEYVDMDALEDAIYNGRINAKDLTDCKKSKQVISLRVKQLKKEE